MKIALAAALLSLLALPAAAQETLTGEEIRAAISGSTVEGSMEASGRYAEFYQEDGVIRGRDYTGTWSIEGDAMCFAYGSDPADCWQVGREGGQILWIKDGAVGGRGEIREGNPNGF